MNKVFDFSVYYHKEDNAYVATCSEYPSLSHTERHPVYALAGLIEIINIIENMKIVGDSNE